MSQTDNFLKEHFDFYQSVLNNVDALLSSDFITAKNCYKTKCLTATLKAKKMFIIVTGAGTDGVRLELIPIEFYKCFKIPARNVVVFMNEETKAKAINLENYVHLLEERMATIPKARFTLKNEIIAE